MLVALVLACFAFSLPASAQIGRVKLAVGTASVLRAGQSLPAKPGLTILEGDTLVTGANGRIGVTFVENTRMSIGPNSRIAISEFVFNPTTRKGKFVTRADRGALVIVCGQIAHENRDAMRVRTPTALLGVRGTRFVVSVP